VIQAKRQKKKPRVELREFRESCFVVGAGDKHCIVARVSSAQRVVELAVAQERHPARTRTAIAQCREAANCAASRGCTSWALVLDALLWVSRVAVRGAGRSLCQTR
jgi:hypothetical protein